MPCQNYSFTYTPNRSSSESLGLQLPELGRDILKAPSGFIGVEEGMKRLIELELGDEREEKLRRRENDLWLAQLDWRWESRGAWWVMLFLLLKLRILTSLHSAVPSIDLVVIRL